MSYLEFPLKNPHKEGAAKAIYNAKVGLTLPTCRQAVLTFGESVIESALDVYHQIAGKREIENPAGMFVILCRQAHLAYYGPPAPKFRTHKRIRNSRRNQQ